MPFFWVVVVFRVVICFCVHLVHINIKLVYSRSWVIRGIILKEKSVVAKVLAISMLLLSMAFVGIALQPNMAYAATSTFGNNSVASSANPISVYKDATKVSLTQSGTIQSITVYFATSGFNAKTAVYADSSGVPGALLSQSSSQRISATGWTTFAVTQKTLSAGKYWLAVLADSASAQGRLSYSGLEKTHVEMLGKPTYASEFSSSFGALAWSNTGKASIYATYTPATQPTPSPSPSPTPSPIPIQTVSPTPTPSSSPSSSPSPVTTLGIYSTSACTSALSSITWGQLTAGTTKTMTLYIRNEGNTPVTLVKALSNWNPTTAASYLTLNWNYSNQAINPGATVTVTLTLTISSSTPAMANFSFNTVITASG